MIARRMIRTGGSRGGGLVGTHSRLESFVCRFSD
jgi:hypothetical protein